MINTPNAHALPMQMLYAPNPPQFDDPWARALVILLVVLGLATFFALGS